MCLYARDVLTEALPGPYTNDDAESFARAALIPEQRFATNSQCDDNALATLFNVPLEQIAKRRLDPLVARDRE